jgi:hypothetical protein
MASGRGRRDARLALAWAALLAVQGTAAARLTLDATGEAGTELHVAVRNTGDETAHRVTPRLVYQHGTVAGDGATLDPGGSRDWRLPLRPPPGPGTFPALLHVEYVDASGWAGSVPLVVLVTASATPSTTVRASLEVGTLAGVAQGRLVLDSTAAAPIAGRVVFVLPGGMSTEPESLPAQIRPGGRTIVPVAIQSRAALPPGRYPVYGVFEYAADGEHRTVLARAEVPADAGRGRRARPLLVGLGALGVTFALLAVAWRRAAAPRG